MTLTQRNEAALAIARVIAEDCAKIRQAKWLDGKLRQIAAGKLFFGDICDDNLYIAEVLMKRNLIPADLAECVSSQEAADIWNEVIEMLPWAAGKVRQERKGAKA